MPEKVGQGGGGQESGERKAELPALNRLTLCEGETGVGLPLRRLQLLVPLGSRIGAHLRREDWLGQSAQGVGIVDHELWLGNTVVSIGGGLRSS